MVDDAVRAKARLITLGVVVAVGAVVAAALAGQGRDELTEAVGRMGVAAPLGFAGLYAALTLLLVPGMLLSLASGFLFGPLLGTVLAVVGGAVGATVAFLIGRRLGRQQVRRLAGPRTERIDAYLRDHAVPSLIIARIIPGMPYSVLNYAAGVTGISVRDYVVGTWLGLVPGALAYAMVGAGLDDPSSPRFLGGIGLVAVVLTAGAVLDRRRRRRNGTRSR